MKPGEDIQAASKPERNPAPGLAGAFSGLWLMTWRGALAWRNWPALLILLFFVPALLVITIGSEHTQVAYFQWTLHFYLLLLLPFYTLVRCGGMIRDEVQADTLSFLLTRPLTRARYFLLKHLSLMLWIQALTFCHGILLAAAGLIRGVEGLAAFLPLFFGVQFLAVVAWTAWSALLGLINRRYIVLGLVYWFVVELGIGRIPTNINTLSLTRHMKTLLAQNETVAAFYGWSSEGPWLAVLAMGTAVLLFLGLSAALFTFREYLAGEETQS